MPKKKKSKETVFPPLWGERREEVDDPTVEEARERIFKFKHSLEVADKIFDQILINKDWEKVGFDTFAEWWKLDVAPLFHSLQVKPLDHIREAGIKQIHEEDAELPAAQRHTQDEIGEMFSVDRSTVSRSLQRANARGADLEEGTNQTNGENGNQVTRTAQIDWDEAERLAANGMSFRQMGQHFGIDESIVRRDLGVRQAKAAVDPDFDVNGASQRHPEGSIACAIEPAEELIHDIKMYLMRLLTPTVYTLSKRDKKNLVEILREALTNLEGK